MSGLRIKLLGLGEHDFRFSRRGQIVERDDNVPPVHLALVDLLRAVIQARSVAQSDRIRGRKQPEIGIGPDHAILIE